MLTATAAHAGSTGFNALPSELLLEIIPHVPYSPHSLSCLCLTCEKLNGLIKGHEHSITTAIQDWQFCQDTPALFPGLDHSYSGLSQLYKRLETLDELHTHWLRVTNNGPDLNWMRDRWEQVHKAGMLLLYRITDCMTHDAKLNLLASLPATSLACLLFKLYSSIKILRIYGPEPINAAYAKQDIMQRSDIELAFEEMLLQHGPDFFVVMLQAGRPEKSAWAVRSVFASALTTHSSADRFSSALEAEIAGMEDRQTPLATGEPKPPTLISALRRAFAGRMGCHLSQNTTKMWEVLSSTAFDRVDDMKLVQIVQGKKLDKGMRRMGF